MSYGGAYASSLWDYVYTISPTNEDFGPTWFFVVTEDPAVVIYDTDGAWTGQWLSSFSYPGNSLNGLPGVRWRWQTEGTPATGTFHFASAYAPALRPWTARGLQDTEYNGDGTTWSASPEPASMALTGLCLFGVAAWKRRRTGLKKD